MKARQSSNGSYKTASRGLKYCAVIHNMCSDNLRLCSDKGLFVQWQKFQELVATKNTINLPKCSHCILMFLVTINWTDRGSELLIVAFFWFSILVHQVLHHLHYLYLLLSGYKMTPLRHLCFRQCGKCCYVFSIFLPYMVLFSKTCFHAYVQNLNKEQMKE